VNVALYGGSFDPPHVAHVLAAAYCLAAGDFDKVLVVPVFSHAFEKALAPFEDRLEMTRLAMQELRGVEVSDVERSLGAPSRTLRTLDRLMKDHPDYRLRVVIGADVLGERADWENAEEIGVRAPWFVLGRAGHPHPEAPAPVLPEVSSTEIRTLLERRTGDAASDPRLRDLVPHAVLRYIDEHGLYRS
jgi:nicotinate-nucleotide adenylyltransferase